MGRVFYYSILLQYIYFSSCSTFPGEYAIRLNCVEALTLNGIMENDTLVTVCPVEDYLSATTICI